QAALPKTAERHRLGQRQPGTEERRPRGREANAVVGQHVLERDGGEADDPSGGPPAAHPAIAAVGGGGGEPPPLVVAPLREDAVQPHVPRAEVRDPRPPGADPVAPSPKTALDDVLADEPERVVVGHARDAGDRSAVELSDEEAPGVGREEARAVVDPGIPALGGGPGPGQLDVLGSHRPDDEVRVGGAHLGSSHLDRTASLPSPWTT